MPSRAQICRRKRAFAALWTTELRLCVRQRWTWNRVECKSVRFFKERRLVNSYAVPFSVIVYWQCRKKAEMLEEEMSLRQSRHFDRLSDRSNRLVHDLELILRSQSLSK